MEEQIRNDLTAYLLSVNEIDEKMPECPDVEGKWKQMAEAYFPDGAREFSGYPLVSLGWMMFLGMAMAQLWDMDWEKYSAVDDLYAKIRDVRGFDAMDDYILEDILQLDEKEREHTSKLVGECAARMLDRLNHAGIEPGTVDALRAYSACLHQLYLHGMAVQLKRLGYRMTLLN